eukprot:COSAG05_NODE_2827_length_2594_cov_36.512811_4_plen_66_part_00
MWGDIQVLTGEDWNAAMYDAVRTNGWGAAVFFISLIIIGGYIMLNLFLAGTTQHPANNPRALHGN